MSSDAPLGLLSPARDTGGRRRYDGDIPDRLYRIRLLRVLGTPVAEVDPNADLFRRAVMPLQSVALATIIGGVMLVAGIGLGHAPALRGQPDGSPA